MEYNQNFIKRMTEKMTKMKEYDQKVKIADEKNIREINDLLTLVNSILLFHGINDPIDKNQIRFNADYIGNISWIDDKKLSKLIFEKIYPTPTRKTFSHYTKFDKGTNIIKNSEFWMFNLLQNFAAEEFRLFYKEHGLDGYEREEEVFGILTGYKPLMSELFALCLTTEENKSSTLWDFFAGGGTGLKLTFEVQSKIPDFREVYYSNTADNSPIPLLKDLFTQIQSTFGYPFNFTYMSKIGAFYLKGDFENEQEFRFLIKRESDDYDARKLQPITYDKDISYIVMPFDSDYATFKLLKVEKGPSCSAVDFDNIIPMIKQAHPHAQIIK